MFCDKVIRKYFIYSEIIINQLTAISLTDLIENEFHFKKKQLQKRVLYLNNYLYIFMLFVSLSICNELIVLRSGFLTENND